MRSRFTPNKNGLVVVTLIKNYGTNVAGEKCGFLPRIAMALVDQGAAQLPGVVGQPEAEEENAPAMTTRAFRPEKPKVEETDPEEMTDDLRGEYKALTGIDADLRWGETRLSKEVEAAKRAKANA